MAGVFSEYLGSGTGVFVLSADVPGLPGGLWDDSLSDGDGVDWGRRVFRFSGCRFSGWKVGCAAAGLSDAGVFGGSGDGGVFGGWFGGDRGGGSGGSGVF